MNRTAIVIQCCTIIFILTLMLASGGCSPSGNTISQFSGNASSKRSDSDGQQSCANGSSQFSGNASSQLPDSGEPQSSASESSQSLGITSESSSNASSSKNVSLEGQGSNKICTDAMIERSVVSEGNRARLARVIRKAIRGESITVGYIGGSITQGAGASSLKNNYAYLVTQWWRDRFPGVKIVMINAGIGATGSVIGAHRVHKDLLIHDPDFVMIEYAVNDLYDNENVRDAYESLIRHVLSWESSPAVMLMFMVDMAGNNVQSMQASIGSHYNLPMLSYKNAIWPEIESGKIRWNDISPDFNHPNDRGHEMVSEIIIAYLENVYDNFRNIDLDEPPLPQKIGKASYVNGEILTLTDIPVVSSDGWSTSYNAFWAFSKGWIGEKNGGKIVFEVESKTINLLYKEAIGGKGRKVRIKLDGVIIGELDSNFPNGWGDYAEYYTILKSEEKKKRVLEIEVIDNAKEGIYDCTFTLLGIMVSE